MMPCYEAKMSSKGQVTLPVEVRRFFNLQEGDRVDFFLDPASNSLRIVARNGKLSDLRGLVKSHSGKLPSPREIDQAVGDHLVEDDDRIKASWTGKREVEEQCRAKSVRAAE